MCTLCNKISENTKYVTQLSKMHEKDIACLEQSKKLASSFSSISAYSTMEYPKLLIKPMFEPKIAFATPLNYFQNLFINNEKMPAKFSSGATRSIFFLGKRLIVFSKSVAQEEGKEFFSHFLLAHFEPNEYSFEVANEKRITISTNTEKTAKDLLTGKIKKINIEFAFNQNNLQGKIIPKDQALQSTLFVRQFKQGKADAQKWLTSTGYMFNYIVSAPHFSPHPYMLQLCISLGYEKQKDFQNQVFDYFRSHYISEKRISN